MLGTKASDHIRGDHPIIKVRYTQPMAENDTNHKKQCVVLLFPILHIFGLLSRKFNLLLILNKQITVNCFVFIYNPIVYLSHVESIQVNNKIILLSRFVIFFAMNQYHKCV